MEVTQVHLGQKCRCLILRSYGSMNTLECDIVFLFFSAALQALEIIL